LFRALWYNCYNLDQHNANIFNILIHKTPTCFGPHYPIIRECSFTRQLLRHAVISSIRNDGETFSVWCTDANLGTIIEQSVGWSVFRVVRCGKTKVNTPQPIGYSTYCAHTRLSISQYGWPHHSAAYCKWQYTAWRLFCTTAVPDDGPVRTKTCRSFVSKTLNCVHFVGLICNKYFTLILICILFIKQAPTVVNFYSRILEGTGLNLCRETVYIHWIIREFSLILKEIYGVSSSIKPQLFPSKSFRIYNAWIIRSFKSTSLCILMFWERLVMKK
jgi:hypothetical protein